VLHFVDRHPGLSVQDLLEILRITKQSLARVLRELVEQGFIDQREGVSDRRLRLLSTTPRGEALARRLAALQASRIERALGEIGPEAGEAARAFLTAMIDEAARSGVIRLMAKAPPGAAG
jgi:DNA-binding MarR family transcriptional regulator